MVTMKDFTNIGSFDALVLGERLPLEVDEEMYQYFLEVVPPRETGETREDFANCYLPIKSYFLVGEPLTHVNGRSVYACFARAYDKYFFLGYVHASRW